MNKNTISLLVMMLFLLTAFSSKDDKSTLKEKVEQSKTVNVFFNLREIVEENDDRSLRASNPNAKTTIRTPIPSEFANAEIKNEVLKILNNGLSVGNAFIEGDLSQLTKSDNSKSHFIDFSKLSDGFYAIIDIKGEYKRIVEKKLVDGTTVFEVSNTIEITSHLYFYEVISGNATKYGDMFMKSGILLGNSKSQVHKSEKLEGLLFMESNLPALPLLAEYKSSMYRLTEEFASRQLKKHEKEISKRK